MKPAASRLKVLHLITRSVVGGAQDNTFSTCELHDRSRFEVHLACNPDGEWVDRARRAADVFHPLPALVAPVHPWRDARALADILRLLRCGRFDLVHTHSSKAGMLGRLACGLVRPPVVVHTCHGFPFHDFMPRWRRALFIQLERAVRPLTHLTITLSENDRREGQRLGLWREEKSVAIYTGISFAKLDAAARRQQTRARLGIAEDEPVVMTAGRLEPQKAPHLLVEAFASVARRHPNARLLLAGDGELRPRVEALIDRLGLRGRVQVLGFRNDVPDLLAAADVFAFSSLWEAMGRAMVEAMLLGRAVVAPAIYGIPEIVRHRETGWLYEVGQAAQLATGLCYLLDHPEERDWLGNQARALTRRLFDVREMVARIESAYADLWRRKAAAPCRPVGEFALEWETSVNGLMAPASPRPRLIVRQPGPASPTSAEASRSRTLAPHS